MRHESKRHTDVERQYLRMREEEVSALRQELDRLRGTMRRVLAGYRTFRNVPEDEQQWTSYDDAAIEEGYAAIGEAA